MSRIPHLPKLLLIMVLLAPAVSLVTPGNVTTAAAQEPLEFVFEGGGWGHGVGMSQYGAKVMADEGFTAAEILGHYYTDSTVETLTMPSTEPDAEIAPLRILLADRSGSATLSLENDSSTPDNYIKIEYGTPFVSETDELGRSVVFENDGSPVTIDAIGMNLTINDVAYDGLGGQVLTVHFPTPMKISGVGTFLWGKIEFSIAKSGTLRVIESNLDMAKYLYGIAEIPSSWPVAALNTQAIAARTYAVSRLSSRRASSGWTTNFDLYSSTQDQHYIGWAGQDQPIEAAWVAAVDNTAAQIATYEGEAIEAYYSSSSGGYTEDSDYVWVADLGYLRGVYDPYDLTQENPNSTWNRTYSQDTVSRWMSGKPDTDVGTVLSMTFVEDNFGVSGRTDRAKLVVVGSERTIEVTGGRVFSRFNAAAVGEGSYVSMLPSTLFTINGSGDTSPDPAPTPTPTPTPVVHIPSGSSNTYSRAALDPLEPGPGEVRVRGWSFDPDLPTFPQVVHVYAFYDGSDTPVALDTPVVLAASPRPDVNRALNVGGNHGFNRRLAIRPGTHKVCVYSISVDGTGATDDLNRLIGCRTVTISAEALPAGTYDSISRTGNEVTVSGWAYDLDQPSASVDIQVYLDGSFSHSISAAVPRTDLNDILDVTGNHGFVDTFTVTDGWHDVCLYVVGIDPGGLPDGQTTALGCK